jgi:hypothetical protein
VDHRDTGIEVMNMIEKRKLLKWNTILWPVAQAIGPTTDAYSPDL